MESRLDAAQSRSETTASSAEWRHRCWFDENFFDHFWHSDDFFLGSYRSWGLGGSTSLILSPRDGVADRAQIGRAVWKPTKQKKM